MKEDSHWLAAVERILRSETGDLRQLALIAGEDARTLYIGTNLDGVDLRGQDLRGMIFTDLDLSKIKHDSKTIFDESINPPDGAEFSDPARVRIYFPDRYDDRWRDRLSRAIPGIEVIEPGNEEVFLEQSRRFYGAHFVVCDFTRKRGLRTVLRNFGPHVTTLIIRRSPYSLSDTSEDEFIKSIPGPIVVLPASQAMFPSAYPPALASLIDFLILALSNWDAMEATLKRNHFSAFLRERSDSFPELAWCRLLGRLHRENLAGCEIVRLVPAREAPAIVGALFPGALTLPTPGAFAKRRRGVPPAVLVNPRQRQGSSSASYLLAIQELLQLNGWEVITKNVSRFSEFEIKGVNDNYFVSIADYLESAEIENFESRILLQKIPDYFDICLDEKARDQDIVDGLMLAGSLRVNARDLAFFRAVNGTRWALIALQLSRMKNSGDTRARTAYLRMILASAIGEKLQFQDELMDLLLSDNYKLKCENYKWNREITTFSLVFEFDISELGGRMEEPVFHIEIDGIGPTMKKIDMRSISLDRQDFLSKRGAIK